MGCGMVMVVVVWVDRRRWVARFVDGWLGCGSFSHSVSLPCRSRLFFFLQWAVVVVVVVWVDRHRWVARFVGINGWLEWVSWWSAWVFPGGFGGCGLD